MDSICFLVNLKSEKIGGLFIATVERIQRLSQNLEVRAVINTSAYDTEPIRLLKKLVGEHEKILSRKPEKEEHDSLVFHNLNYRRGLLYYLLRVLWPGSGERLETRCLLRKYRHFIDDCEIVHAHWGWPNGYYADLIGGHTNKEYCITFHGSDINRIDSKILPFLLSAMSKAKVNFFVSSALLKTARNLGYEGKNCLVSYNGVDTGKFDPSLYVSPTRSSRCVGFIGALREIKGAKLIPEVFEEVRKRFEGALSFLVVGDGELSAWVRKRCDEKQLEVNFTGAVSPDSIPEYLNAIDVLIMPSLNEGLGLMVLEANAMNVPVVGTNRGGLPEAIGFPENIIPMDSLFAENMALRVVQLLNEDECSPKYRERVLERFTWDKIVAVELEAYSSVMS